MGLADSLRGKRVYFDANIFIYMLEGSKELQSQIQTVRDLLSNGEIEVVTCDVTYTEILPHPARRGDTQAIETMVEYLSAFEVIPLTKEITIHAGILRGETGMKSPDALHVAAAMQADCEILVTNDGGIKTPTGMLRLNFKDFS